MKIAFQGVAGAYSHEAAMIYGGRTADPIAYASFEEVFVAVEKGEMERGIVPLENSISGTIHRNYDLLLGRVYVVGEVEHQINHCLMAMPGTKLGDVKTVCSHIQAITQCDKYLRSLGVRVEAMYDTAGSARHIRDNELRGVAALASRRAAELYDLEVLAESVQDYSENITRFAVIVSELDAVAIWPSADANKCLIVFVVQNVVGALERAVHVFSSRGINFTKLESRPSFGEKWGYRFLVELEYGSAKQLQEALQEFETLARWHTVRGKYPKWNPTKE